MKIINRNKQTLNMVFLPFSSTPIGIGMAVGQGLSIYCSNILCRVYRCWWIGWTLKDNISEKKLRKSSNVLIVRKSSRNPHHLEGTFLSFTKKKRNRLGRQARQREFAKNIPTGTKNEKTVQAFTLLFFAIYSGRYLFMGC